MSWKPRTQRILDSIEHRWESGHRAGRVHPFERSRILAGDTTVIIRDLEPGFEVGQECVLSWSHEIRTALRDENRELTGEVAITPRVALFTITVNRKIRRKSGDWAVRYDIVDRREPRRLVRRKPPSLREGQYAEATKAEIELAAVESAYTGNPKQAVDHLDAVDHLTQKRMAREARERDRESLGDLLAAVEDFRSALSERIEANPGFMQSAGRDVWLVRSKLDRLVSNAKKRAA